MCVGSANSLIGMKPSPRFASEAIWSLGCLLWCVQCFFLLCYWPSELHGEVLLEKHVQRVSKAARMRLVTCPALFKATSFTVQRRQWQPTPVLLPGKSHGQRSLVGYSPGGRKESDTTERLPFHFSLSCTGEGNGNPLQYSCLANPSDSGACWATIYGVAQSRTWLTLLSRSSSTSWWSSCLPLIWLMMSWHREGANCEGASVYGSVLWHPPL